MKSNQGEPHKAAVAENLKLCKMFKNIEPQSDKAGKLVAQITQFFTNIQLSFSSGRTGQKASSMPRELISGWGVWASRDG